MTMKSWLAAHRSASVAALSGAVIAVVIIAIAVVSTGYSAQKLTLDDGSVWVANGSSEVIGRANPQVLALNSVVASTGTELDVVQQGATVLLFDRTNAKLDIVDPATSAVLDSVPLPPDTPQVFLAGDNVVIGSGGSGEFWIVPLSGLAHFDAQSQPTLSLGADASASVSPTGELFVYSAAAHKVFSVDAANSDVVEQTSDADFGAARTGVTITSVSGHWVLLDADRRRILTQSGVIDLAKRIPVDSLPVLQQAASSGTSVLVAYAGGLLDVPLSGGTPSLIDRGHSGVAVAPMVSGPCSYAAWSDGVVWRHCDGSAARSLTLEAVPTGAVRLAFAENNDTVVLNDPRGGGTWAVQQSGEYINNWSQLISVDKTHQQVQDNNEDTPPQYDKTQEPPVAVNDSFGARPGRATVLPVLLNDYDPNGDALVISGFTPIDPKIGRLDLINDAQQLQLTLNPAAIAPVKFDYTITDGRGGSASASVAVAIRQPSENSPPVQVRQTKTLVVQGGRVTTSVLGDWVDPDGDAFYLVSATTAAPDSVSYRPDGTVVFSDGGAASAVRSVTLVVSDGRAEATGSLLITVKPSVDVPIIPESFSVQAYSGQETTISPLSHVRGGSGVLRLASVPAKIGATITASLDVGTFTFVSTQIGTHYLDYVVNDGSQTATGEVRVEVLAPPDATSKPITIPKTMFVQSLSTATVEVASTDIDPAGGVLLVTGIYNLAADSGVRANVIDAASIRVTLTAPLDKGPVAFNYRITNGLANADGEVTVVQIPVPTKLQPPVANDDSVTVRVGDAITIPVLANDSQPEGAALTLNPLLSKNLTGDSGLLFASGNVLRYLAPNKTGDFTAVYAVSGPDGQTAQAQVKIAVREANIATNNPPVPQTVIARVFAGSTVRIKIPLTGIDPDGDSVQLLGQESSPEKGSVIATGADYFDYLAGDYSAGTDSFTYTVVDSLGARATGIVRVGISPKVEGARNPVAVEDDVTSRPGSTVSVQVLANDSDPDGGTLTVTKVKPNGKNITAKIVGDIVQVTPPRIPGTYGVLYTVENGFGGTSSNFIKVTVDAKAPRAYPQVTDTVLTLTDILGQDSIDVNVLRSTFFADGPASSLKVSLLPGYSDNVSVTANKRIRVKIEAKSQIIPFAVANPDDSRIVSYAFVWVPGLNDALPQLNLTAPPLSVSSESELRIDLNQYVLAIGGKKVRLTSSTKVQATHANGDSLVVNDHTLRFTSAERYFGPASISFEVTDGTSASDPNGRIATLVLPINVTPRQNQPPTFVGGNLDFEPGASRTIDLTKLTNYPHPKDVSELAYTVVSPLPVGFSYTLTGQQLVLTANDSTPTGTSTAIQLSVRDALSTGQSGRIILSVVPSTRPLAQPAPDAVVIQRGQTQSVDVLANDEATNPFPGSPLTVIAIRGIDGSALPVGVSVSPSADRSRLTVSASAAAVPGNTTLQYEVADATNDPSRYVFGTITISVQDKPDPVTVVTATSFGDRRITLRWTPGADNNSPITGFSVLEYSASNATTPLSTTPCSVSVCDVTTPGNGPVNAVGLRVVANNSLGSSTPVGLGSTIWSDLIPSAPSSVAAAPLDGGLHITWNPVIVPSGGSAVNDYAVTAGGVAVDVIPSTCSLSTCSANVTGLSNGQPVNVTVSPHNGAFAALTTWNVATTSGTPAGAPLAVAPPTAVANDSTISASWAGAFAANGRPITNYKAYAYSGSPPVCDPANAQGDGATSATFDGLSDETSYTIVVFAWNSQGCTASAPVVAHTSPGVITAATFGAPSDHGTVFDDVLASANIGATALGSDYSIFYQLANGSEHGPITIGGFLAADAAQFGAATSVQLRACRSYDGAAPICQTQLSASFALPTPVNPQVSGVTFTPSSDGTLNHNGTFSWLSWPAGSYQSVQFACGSGNDNTFVVADLSVAGGSCSTTVNVISNPTLTIRVIANGGQVYDISYDQNGNGTLVQ